MMVTFVSQCEKNALKKTRRVLDAFANRIGDNTWQTLITEEGLLTVKKMLRKTASRSTAVSCHWIRSRSRSQLLWVVGNRAKFNEQGVVPVNYTTVTDIKMDEIKIMNEIVYANTQKQVLSHHLFAVGYVASQLVERLLEEGNNALVQAAYVSGCLHDIGKLDPQFRSWIDKKISKQKKENVEVQEDGWHIDQAKFSFENHPRHNEISLWLCQFMNIEVLLANKKLTELVEHTIYWHHAKPIRKEEYFKVNDIHRKMKKSYDEKVRTELVEHCQLLIKEVAEIQSAYPDAEINTDLSKSIVQYDEEKADEFKKIDLPYYKYYEPEDNFNDYLKCVSLNAKSNILRASVITADRKISALSAEQLDTYIDTGTLDLIVDDILSGETELTQHLQDCLKGFAERYPNSERNSEQSKAAKLLTNIESVAVLNGPAGCGKTKIALEWAKLKEANKLVWVCPRVQVCEGLYQDLTSGEYLPNVKIEICTGEFKYFNNAGDLVPTPEGEEFSGDIVLTTIDQVINGITTHTNISTFVDFLQSHIVFDEYHEYIPMSGFNLLFAELIQAKQLMGDNANTLLVSATPNYCFLNRVLEIDSLDVVGINSFNNSEYKIKFETFDETKRDESNPLYRLQPENSIVISNTATTAQQAFITNQTAENAILFHGKFKTSDKKIVFNNVFESFKNNGSRNFDVLRSGPIVQASLNITCSNMVTEFTVAENMLQRLGRLDRFGESDEINQLLVAIPNEVVNTNGKIQGSCARFLNNHHSYRSAYIWYEFLVSKLSGKSLSIDDIYTLYEEFYASPAGKGAVESDLLTALKDSATLIADKVHDPIRFVRKTKTTKKKLKKSSLRGDSRFVQMAKLNITSFDNYLIDESDYAINWQDSDLDFFNCYTESLSILRSTGLLDYVAKKHGRIDTTCSIEKIPAKKMSLRKQILESEATEPQHPIFLSYTPQDLAEKLGESEPDEAAIYYVIGSSQVVGAMSLNNILQFNNN